MLYSKIKNKRLCRIGALSTGIVLRYAMMLMGYNYDFESYCIVGEIAGNLGNVYAQTARYNYSPIYLCVLGIFYRISQVMPDYWTLIYRWLIVTLLIIADMGIFGIIDRRYSFERAVLFFLNPVSIVITGYHNQFDNIAVLFALLSTVYFIDNDDTKVYKRDIGVVIMITMSLLIKHILFLFPVFILLMDGLSLKKKVLYAIVPVAVFLLSFVPFAISGQEAIKGIVYNVFLYRSFNNAPLLSCFYELIKFPYRYYIISFSVMMIAVSCMIRKYQFEYILLIYLIALVAFSSAIANQYLVIPIAALCILNVGCWDKIYLATVSILLILHPQGLGIIWKIQAYFPNSIMSILCNYYVKIGYTIAAWILLFALAHLFLRRRKTVNRIY